MGFAAAPLPLVVCALLTPHLGATLDTGAGGGELIAFVQPTRSAVATTFETVQLPNVRELAAGLGMAVKVVDVSAGAPPEITTTPTIVFQNHRGRSFYYGRLTTLDRLRAFIAAAAMAPHGTQGVVRQDVLVRNAGRARVAARIKIAAVTGDPPGEIDHQQFVIEATESIMKGLATFTKRPSIRLSRTDRTFYMDFNPWLSADGTLFLSTELYSQFHCKKPVFRHVTNPHRGPWKDRDRLFAAAASELAQALSAAMRDDVGGDGFDPVPDSVAVRSWEDLGLALSANPAEPGASQPSAIPVTLQRRWQLIPTGTEANSTMVFNFPSPLEGYAGQVQSINGTLNLAEGLFVSGATGHFEADPTSVTMGEPDLDDALRGATFLQVAKHPIATFEIRKAEGDGHPVAVGITTPSTFEGIFTLKGVQIPLAVHADMTVSVTAKGIPRLTASGAFKIPLTPFDLEGPDSTVEASKSLEFQFRLDFRAADSE